MDYGIKISKSGSDVKTCDDDDLLFSSKFNVFKSFIVGSFNVSVGATSSVTTNVAHGLSYSPSFEVFVTGDAAGSFWCPVDNGSIQYSMIPNKVVSTNVYSNTTNLVIQVGNSDSVSRTFTVKYFIYKDEVQ